MSKNLLTPESFTLNINTNPTSSFTNTNSLNVASLIDDFRASELPARLNAFKNLSFIASALGPSRTREELVPYLLEFVDDEDEVLSILASGIAELIPSVGGSEHAHILLPPLQHIANAEETSIREKAVQSIIAIAKVLPNNSFVETCLPLVNSLSIGDWFTSRMSACGLLPFLYAHKSVNVDIRKTLKLMFLKLCGDETPMVRRSACSSLAPFAASAYSNDPQIVSNDLIPTLVKLSNDEQDSVRLLVVDAVIGLALLFNSNNGKPSNLNKENLAQLIPLIEALCIDKSWRVRYIVADKFKEVCSSLGPSCNNNSVIDGFVRLLNDEEAEVRTAAASKVGETAACFGQEQTINKLLNPVKRLVTDSNQYTRAAVGSVLMSLGKVLNKQDLIEHIVPLLLLLLKDTAAEVRLNVIGALSTACDVLSVDTLRQSLLPAMTDLANDPKWRVRLALIEHIPTLASQLGSAFFDAKLSDMCMTWLGDSVYSIREAATINLTRLASVFGTHWAKHNIVPKVVALASHKSYLFRMTSLHSILDLSPVVGSSVTVEKLLPVLVTLSNDPVPNVRFTCAKVLGTVYTLCSPSQIQEIIKPQLIRLSNDSDPEAQYYATQALETINQQK